MRTADKILVTGVVVLSVICAAIVWQAAKAADTAPAPSFTDSKWQAFMIMGDSPTAIVEFHRDGTVIWRGHEVKGDEQFRKAMMDMAVVLAHECPQSNVVKEP
jgi:hypothetical protein